MSDIRVVRNASGNCINFVGTSNPAYWNGCLTAEVDDNDPTRINIINKIRTIEEERTVYEFFRIPFDNFSDADGNLFADATEAALYITQNANVVTNRRVDILMDPNDTIDFQRDVSNTTIFVDNGDAYSINELQAVDAGDGTISIIKRFSNNPDNVYVLLGMNHQRVTIAGSSPGTVLADIINNLNSLFTYSPLGAGGATPLPSQPTDGGVFVTGEDSEGQVPVTGNPTHLLTTGGGTSGHDARYWSTETIDQAGEYYTVKITGRGRFILGLGREEDGDRAEMENDSGAAASGLIWGNAFYNYGSYIAPWTTYGSSSGLSYGPGWNGPQVQQYRYNTEVQDAHDNFDPILFRVGIDAQGYISVWYYDITRSNDWVLTARRSVNTEAGNYFLVVKLWDGSATLVETPLRFATDPVAPTLNYRFIESPDGVYTYPLFGSFDEAAYVDLRNGGIGVGSAHVHVYPDDPTSSNWYMPNNGGFMGISTAPISTVDITYTEIPTLADDLYAPGPLTLSDYSVSENTNVNIQVLPQDIPATVTGLPVGLVYNNGFITGTAPYVIRDEVFPITVTRSNLYGTTTQTFTITISDNASLSNIAGFTETQGNFVQPNRIILDYDALVQYDTQINPGEQLTYSYGGGQLPPTIGILSGIGVSNLAAFDPDTDTLGTISGVNDFAEKNNWALRYVSFGGFIGDNPTKHQLVGWTTNTTQPGSEGTLTNSDFKLEYGLDGIFRLYVDNNLRLTGLTTFTGPQTLTFAGFEDQQQSDIYIPLNLGISSSFDPTTPPTGFVSPVESGQMTSPTLFGPDTDGAVYISELLKINHRYIVPRTWIEANVLPYITGTGAGVGGEKFFFGVPRDGTDLTSVGLVQDFHAVFRLEGGTNAHFSRLYTSGISGTADDTVLVSSNTNAFYDYAIEWDGTDLHVIACNLGDINTQPAISQGGAFSRVTTLTDFGPDHGKTNQELNLVIGIKDEASVNLSTIGLQQIRTPWSQNTILVGEASNGNGQFGQVQSTQFDVGGQHAPGSLSYFHPSINAGYTYTYIYDPSLEGEDGIEFRLASDNTTVYTTGITSFNNGTSNDPNAGGTEGYKGITFTVPQDVPPLRAYYFNEYQSGAFDAGRDVPISGSTYTVPVTGVTIEGPAANFTGNVINAASNGWISLNETLSAGERLVLDSAFLQDLDDAIPDNSVFWVGLKSTGWTDASFPTSAFFGTTAIRFRKTTTAGFSILGYANGGLGSQIYSASLAASSAFLEITGTGNNIRVGYYNSTAMDAATTTFADWDGNTKIQTGDRGYGINSLEVVLYWQAITGNSVGFDISQVDWAGLSEISIPQPVAPLTTPWNKALDFGGRTERLILVNNSTTYSPLQMRGSAISILGGQPAGETVSSSAAAPWAIACMLKTDRFSTDQYIWNQGEGTGSNDDNVYLRTDALGAFYFGWGRTGSLNEIKISDGFVASRWYGVYVASTGQRLAEGDATASNLADCFDIRILSSSDSFGSVGDNLAQTRPWTTIGGRMNRTVGGDFTIGGRGAANSFRGDVAACTVTTLRIGQPMPDEDEIKMLVRDPLEWAAQYKVGNPYRSSFSSAENPSWQFNDGFSASTTQIWLMGDGTGDAYAQIRNQVFPATQNNTPLNMISMLSNDIQTINIPGLT